MWKEVDGATGGYSRLVRELLCSGVWLSAATHGCSVVVSTYHCFQEGRGAGQDDIGHQRNAAPCKHRIWRGSASLSSGRRALTVSDREKLLEVAERVQRVSERPRAKPRTSP